MPRYYLEIAEESGPSNGEVIDLPDLIAVQRLAVRYTSELLIETMEGILEKDIQLKVTDEDGLTLFAVVVVATEPPAIRRFVSPRIR